MSKEFGKRLASLRKAAGFNQQDFQKACGWGDGTKNSRISNYETGTNEPTLADIEVMATILKVSPAHLAYGTPDTLTPDEAGLIAKYRATNSQGRKTLTAIAEAQPVYGERGDPVPGADKASDRKSQGGR